MSDFQSFIELYKRSKRVAVLSGAGVSTLSGIPDFRSSDGVYSKQFGKMDVERILDISFFNQHPDVFYSWAKDNWYIMDRFQPNIIHKTLAELESRGRITEGIFTQNIDGLHQRAGSKKVYELHGSVRKAYCTECNAYYTYESILPAIQAGSVPTCKECHGVIKPDIVFYGEGLDMTTLMRAENAFANCDLALVLGSSLVVNPAASLPYISAQKGKSIVIVNRDSTYLDRYASLCFDDLGSFFEKLHDYISNNDI